MRTGLRPFKKFSQNFLKDEGYAERLVDAMGIEAGDVIVEIGAGEGVLTHFLMQSRANHLMAVEIDRRMHPWLTMRFGDDERFELIPEDILKLNLSQAAADRNYTALKICGNLPYAITSPILFGLLENRHLISDVTVTVQKEVAERFVSPPGSKAYGVPSVLFQLYGDLSLLFTVPRQAFDPVPKVESAVIQCRFLKEPRYPLANFKVFEKLVKSAFGQRRKMLRNTIGTLLGESAGQAPLDLSLRPEQVSVETWVETANFINPGK